MCIFPQELVEQIIDRLAEPDPSQPLIKPEIASYSMVSRGWLDRIRKHNFVRIHLENQDTMSKWVATIDPNESGISKYVRTLYLTSIECLEGFETHMQALTGVKNVGISSCPLFKSPGDVRIFTEGLGGTLVDLEIDETRTTPEILVSLLAGLPHLRTFYANALTVKRNRKTEPIPSPEGIPFFESGNGRFKVLLDDPSKPGQFCWVPPTAKFSRVGVGMASMFYDLEFINELVASSGGTLTHFVLEQDTVGSPSGHIDLSKCTSLTTVRVPVLVDLPWWSASHTLPSISSSRFSTVILAMENVDDEPVEPEDWEELEVILSRLAKRLKTMHGTNITVAVDARNFNRFDESITFSLKEEVDVEIWKEIDDGCEPFPGFVEV